ncbi:hypothetical protein [Cereibacter azotoformans]|uniref:hypothetical protein n=1 Tax=Cereibacter azotoformans TaxID=43057 RepID=UPI000C6C9E09|nr:hypothetical protein [Cereibacter azotoformans]
MSGAIPYDRPMTEDERRGFRMALACMIAWARQIEDAGFRLGGPAEPMIPRHEAMRHAAQQTRHLAEALDLTIGQSNMAFEARSLPRV